MDSKATGSGGSAANTRQFVTEGSSPDVEMSPVPEGAGLERAPPLDHSVDVPLGSAAEQEDQQSQSSAISKSARADTDSQLVLITLISRMQDKYKDNFKSTSMSAEELQQFKLQCSTALDAPALSEILMSLKLSPDEPEHMIALNFSFYNYCGPLLLPRKNRQSRLLHRPAQLHCARAHRPHQSISLARPLPRRNSDSRGIACALRFRALGRR